MMHGSMNVSFDQINMSIFVMETSCTFCKVEYEISYIMGRKFAFKSFKKQFQEMFTFYLEK